MVLKEGRLDLSSGRDKIEVQSDQPGMLYAAVEPYAPEGVAYTGGHTGRDNGLYAVAAAVAPTRIGLSVPARKATWQNRALLRPRQFRANAFVILLMQD